jgi:hypothetical protein
MYWNIVEVKPEPGFCLAVRFADGLQGRIHLAPEEMRGALAPLRDPEYFRQVFLDHGAVSWPGEIDLAPDALYRQVRECQYSSSSDSDRRE